MMEKERADQMIGIRIPKSIGERLESLAQKNRSHQDLLHS